MKEQTEINIKIIGNRITELGDTLYGNLPYNMPPLQVLLSFLFLRRIDCMIGKYAEQSQAFYQKYKERYNDERMLSKMQSYFGGYPFYNFSGLNFDSILLSDKSIDIVINNYIQGFSNNVQEIMEGLLLRNSIAILQRQSKFLEIVIRTFIEIDLSTSSVDDEEFVELTYSLIDSMGGASYRGGYMTPLPLAKLMSEILFQQMPPQKDCDNPISIYDPVCGTGRLLAHAYIKAISCHSHHYLISLYGQDLDFHFGSIAKAMALLLGNENSMICHDDTLTNDMFPNNKFDYILADMPLGQSWKHIKDKIERGGISEDSRFVAGFPIVNDSQFLFIEHMVSKMAESGSRVVFATSGSILWNGAASSGESRIRRWLFENDLVECIISLPQGMLSPSTSIPIYLWVLSNKKNAAQKGKVRLINASSADRINRLNGIDEDFVKSVIDEYKSKIISVRSQIVNNEQFGYYEVDLLENGKKKERVTISLDTDIHEFVEKERQPYAKGEITIDYTSVEKGYSVQFEKIFPQEKEDIVSLVDATQDLVPVIDTITALKADIVKIQGRSESKTWAEYPLRAATEVVFGINRPPIENNNGLPILSVPFLRKPSNDVSLYEVTPKTKCSTVNDAIVIVKGENTGEVFKGVDGILTSSVATIKCTDEKVITPQYLYYLLKGYEKELRSMAKGATIKSLDSKSIPNLKCMIPPIEEQQNLVAFLDVIVGKIDDVINVLGGSNNVFVHYRQTLIENVVHGRVIIK